MFEHGPLFTDGKTNYPSTRVECEDWPPDGAVDRQESVSEKLNCGERVYIEQGVETREKRERRQLASRPTVLLHRLTYTDIDKWCSMCGPCGKGDLVSRKVKHTINRLYECLTCGRDFSCRKYLVTHERTHTGERPYTCVTCGKGFQYRTNLVVHERTHTDERPYKCIACGKAFKYRSRLSVHERAHTDERLYKCIACGKAFKHRSHLTVHERRHIAE